MKRKTKKILSRGAIALAAAAVILLVFALYAYFHKPFLKNRLEKSISKKPGISLEIGGLDYRIFPLRVEADSVLLTLKNDLGEIRASVDRAEAKGGLRRILGKKKPLLEALAVTGLEVTYAQSPDAPPSEELSLGDLARMASDALAHFGDLSIENSAFRVDLPSMGLALACEDFDLTTSMRENAAYDLRFGRLTVRKTGPEVSFAGAVSSSGSWARRNLEWFKGNLSLAEVAVSLPERGWEFTEEGFSFAADFSLDEQGASFSGLSASVPGLLALSGSGQAGWEKDAPLSASLGLDVDDITRARTLIAPFLPSGLPDLRVEGGLSWRGEYRRGPSAGGLQDSLDGTLTLPPARAAFRSGDLAADLILAAELRLEGPTRALGAAGKLKGTDGRVRTETFRSEGVSFSFPLGFEDGRLTVPSFELRLGDSSIAAGNGDVRARNVLVRGKASIDLEKGTIDIPSLDVGIPELGSLTLRGRGRFATNPEFAVKLSTTDMDIGTVMELFSPAVPAALNGWAASGKIRISLDAGRGPGGSPRTDIGGTVGVEGASFQNSSGNLISEGLSAGLEFESSLEPAGDGLRLAWKFDLPKGESLWNEAYFNWSDRPLHFEGNGKFGAEGGTVNEADAVLDFASLGTIRINGSFRPAPKPAFDVDISAPSFDLGSFYSLLSAFRPAQPAAWDLTGRAALDVRLRIDDRFSAKGRIRVREGLAKQKAGSTEIGGLEADLPFSISNRTGPPSADDDFSVAPGRIVIGELKTAAMSFGRLDLAFLSARNLFLLYPLSLDAWGSRIDLGKTVLTISPLGLAPYAVSSIELGELDLSRLTAGSPAFQLVGKAAIPESRLVIRPGEILLQGRLSADLFSGRMTARNIRARDPFSESRTVFFEAEIKELDLEKLTDAVPFGKVTGIVDITIGNFALSYGQPESFDLKIESVPAKGVPKKFSLKAVNDLQVISSGGGSSMPSGGFFARFVSSFNYERIGIACSLRNDVFTLQSTVVEGGVHYLVRRSPLFGIDVVNKKPVNRIGFKDMLGRLKRVGQSQEKK